MHYRFYSVSILTPNIIFVDCSSYGSLGPGRESDIHCGEGYYGRDQVQPYSNA